MSPLKLVLDIFFVLISLGLLIIAAIWLNAYTCTETACGDVVLISILPIITVGLLSIVYLIFDVFYLVAQSRHHKPVAKRHVIALVLIIGVILFICLRILIDAMRLIE